MTALLAPALMGFAGIAVDIGWWYTVKRQNQSAADSAVLAAAYELTYNPSWTAAQLTPFASQAATLNGYTGSTPVVTYPYSDGFVSSGIQVELNQNQDTWFVSFSGLTKVTIYDRAVALVTKLPPACMLALNPTANDTINLAGNPSIDAPDCTIVSDSDSSSALHLQGAASITAATVITPGEIAHTGGAYTLSLTIPAQTGAQFVPDPYAPPNCAPTSCLTHANFLTDGLATASACTSSVVNGITTYSNPGSYSPGCVISGGLAIKNSTVDLSPGTYWITDGDLDLKNGSGATLECTSCSNGGAGVTIVMTTAMSSGGYVGTVRLGSNANLSLNAPSSGPFAGDVLIQDSNGLPTGTTGTTVGSDTFHAQANATETLSGLVYFPDAAVTFQGTPDASGPQCLLLVANTVGMQGNPSLATSGCSSLGLNKLPIVYTVTLVE